MIVTKAECPIHLGAVYVKGKDGNRDDYEAYWVILKLWNA